MAKAGAADLRRGATPGPTALVVLACSALGCGGRRAASPVERQLAEALAAQLGRAVEVRCETTAPSFGCTAACAGAELPIHLVTEAAQLRWQLDGLVIDGDRLAQYVVGELASLGLTATADCGATLRVVAAGEQVACQLGGLGVAWATIHPDGGYSVEVALGAAALARTEAVDEVQLDALSRALDRDPERSTAADADELDDDDDDDGDHRDGGDGGDDDDDGDHRDGGEAAAGSAGAPR